MDEKKVRIKAERKKDRRDTVDFLSLNCLLFI